MGWVVLGVVVHNLLFVLITLLLVSILIHIASFWVFGFGISIFKVVYHFDLPWLLSSLKNKTKHVFSCPRNFSTWLRPTLQYDGTIALYAWWHTFITPSQKLKWNIITSTIAYWLIQLHISSDPTDSIFYQKEQQTVRYCCCY